MDTLSARVLIAEEDASLSEILKGLLRSFEHRVRSCSDPLLLRELLQDRSWDLFFCDAAFWHKHLKDGDFLQLALNSSAPVPVIMLADYAANDLAALAQSKGAAATLHKPIKSEAAMQIVNRLLQQKQADPKVEELAEDIAYTDEHFDLLVGEHKSMLDMYAQIKRVAESEMTVLIQGESGTGKELVAKAIHKSSPRADKAFIAINCASLPENLLESELFGHLKGAFTGAVRDKDGLFLAADGGTLFLDEVGAIPVSMQLALLRALQEREIRPVGGLQNIQVDVRVISASNEDLRTRMDKGLLRNDLFYRLSVFPINIPPLRERSSDIAILTKYFLKKHQIAEKVQISQEALQALSAYQWPGNVRELENCLQRALTMCEDQLIKLEDLPEYCQTNIEKKELDSPTAAENATKGEFILPSISGELTLKAYLRHCERHYLRYVLELFNGDKEAAAKTLGISLATFYRKHEE